MDSITRQLDNISHVQKNGVSGEITGDLTLGRSGHSSFIEKLITKKIISINPKEKEKEEYRKNNRESTVSNVSKPTDETHIPDTRFLSQKFKDDVRFVLESLGLESNFGNFKRWDRFINWSALASNLQSPTRVSPAPCSICGQHDKFMVEIIDTNKKACSRCWSKVQKCISERRN